MSLRRRSPFAAAKRALLVGAAIAAIGAGPALAQRPGRPTPPPPPAPDGLQPGELYMEADQVIRDDQKKVTTAQGAVEVRYQGRTLRADRVVYQEGENGQKGVIRAFGHVQVINADGSVDFADQLVLDDKMQAGAAQGFSTRMPQTIPGFGALDIKLAGATAVRRSEDVQELNRAIYTPCPVCAQNHAVKPTWSIAAERVVEDKPRRIIYYRHARILVHGVPILYFPIFWHADPSAERVSGLLGPKFQISDRRGFSYEQPYLFTLTPSTDLILSPQINTKVNPLLNGRIRQRFYSGDIDLRFGYTYERDFDSSGHKFGDGTSRSYILGRGGFQVSDTWRWGFTAERTSDPLLFDKYQIGDVYLTRGPYIPDDRRLISQVYAARQDTASYFSAAAMSFQGLRAGDNDRTFPIVAPLVEAHYDDPDQLLGGRLRVTGSAVALTRDQSPTDPTARLPGLDSRRVTGEVNWQRAFTSDAGLRVEPFIDVRADAYSLGDILTGVGAQTTSREVTRGLAVAGANVTYPFYRRFSDFTVVLEPQVQLAASPRAKQILIGRDASGQPVFFNEDSVAFDFDETTLFRTDKFPGYDLYEDGVRLNVAGRAEVLWDDGRRANLLIGRSFRDKANTVFPATSGLQGRASDWIVAADAQPIKGLSFFARARLDSDDLSVHRAEAGVNLTNKWGTGFVRYLRDDSNLLGPTVVGTTVVPAGQRVENFELGGDVPVGKNWGITAYGNRDMIQHAWVIRDIGVYYRDDCVRVDVIYRREDTVIGRLGPADSIALRLTLATLGSPFTVR
ncbi:LPS assembly protein LptD [Phenylobacterium sp.]|uniref:LPS-assembly protein LptD n=1 Tax=Phenylobacterium sp. TaxID=1871053 RepID=UPI00261BD9F6|nr:LPS assembly protein LptD [Phenylobacterium sp.]